MGKENGVSRLDVMARGETINLQYKVAITNEQTKNRSLDNPPRLPMPIYSCEWSVLNSAHRTRFAGQTIGGMS